MCVCVCCVFVVVWCTGGRSRTGALLKRWRSGNQTVTLVGKVCAVLHCGHLGSSSFTACTHTHTHTHTHPWGNRCMHSYTQTHTIAMRINAALGCSLRGWIVIGETEYKGRRGLIFLHYNVDLLHPLKDTVQRLVFSLQILIPPQRKILKGDHHLLTVHTLWHSYGLLKPKYNQLWLYNIFLHKEPKCCGTERKKTSVLAVRYEGRFGLLALQLLPQSYTCKQMN